MIILINEASAETNLHLYLVAENSFYIVSILKHTGLVAHLRHILYKL